MQIHFFNLPVVDGERFAQELNALLNSHRVAEIRKEFVDAGIESYWSICVTTVSGQTKATTAGKSRIDYREVLPEADFLIFADLRTLRKELAEKEGVPPYAIFTNEQLAEMSKQRIVSLSGLRTINGVGAARVEKYGDRFIQLISSVVRQSTSNGVDSVPVMAN